MRPLSHLTPYYIRKRLGVMFYEWRNPDLPWLTCDMVNILESWIKPTDVGLEFGSGRSTKWFISRIKHLTSVENDPTWHKFVSRQIKNLSVDYFLHTDVKEKSVDSAYVGVARKKPSSSLDFCLIDGRARDHCALACLDKIKAGGILIIDDAERYIPRSVKTFSPNARGSDDGYASEVWKEVGVHIEKWRCVWTTNGIKDTAFWVKP